MPPFHLHVRQLQEEPRERHHAVGDRGVHRGLGQIELQPGDLFEQGSPAERRKRGGEDAGGGEHADAPQIAEQDGRVERDDHPADDAHQHERDVMRVEESGIAERERQAAAFFRLVVQRVPQPVDAPRHEEERHHFAHRRADDDVAGVVAAPAVQQPGREPREFVAGDAFGHPVHRVRREQAPGHEEELVRPDDREPRGREQSVGIEIQIGIEESGAVPVSADGVEINERQEFPGAESFAQGHEPRDMVDAVVPVGDPREDEQGQETEEDERAQQSGVETSAGDAFQRAVGESFKRCDEVDCFHVRSGPGWDRDAPTRGTGVCV